MLIVVLHGPNLNLLGSRQPELYGTTTLIQLNDDLKRLADELGVQLRIEQHNSEGALIDAVHTAALRMRCDQPAAYFYLCCASRRTPGHR